MGTFAGNSKTLAPIFIIMKKIIIATDFSAEAENAMLYAAAAALEQGYEMILFTLHNISIHALNARLSSGSIDELLAKKQEHLDNIALTLSSAFGISITPHFATGDLYEELNRCIETHHADLVVVGMARKTIEQELLGNTTTKALYRLKSPVLAIPLSAKYSGIKRILFACDIVRGVHGKVLDNVKHFSQDFGATVEVFHVCNKVEELSKKNENLEQIQQGLNEISYQYKNVQSTQIIKAIKEEMESIKADLLIMVPYRYGFWDSLVHRSKTRMMASGSNTPLLSLPL